MPYKSQSHSGPGETFDADTDLEGQYDLSQITLEPTLSGSTITQHAPTDTAADITADPSSGTHTHIWSRLTNGRLFQSATPTATAGEGEGSHSHSHRHQHGRSRRSRTATFSRKSLRECATRICAGCGAVAVLSAAGGLCYLFFDKIPEWADHTGPEHQICAPGGPYMNRTYGDPTHGTTVCCQKNIFTPEQEEMLWDPDVLSHLVEVPGSPQGSRLNETYPDELPNHIRNYCRYNRTGTD